jgi:hypothetical protein
VQYVLQSGAILRGNTDPGIHRAESVPPSQHLAHVVRLDQAAAGEPAQHPHAYLLGDGGDILWRQFSGGAKTDGLGNITGILSVGSGINSGVSSVAYP